MNRNKRWTAAINDFFSGIYKSRLILYNFRDDRANDRDVYHNTSQFIFY